jgi:hypothetical protein
LTPEEIEAKEFDAALREIERQDREEKRRERDAIEVAKREAERQAEQVRQEQAARAAALRATRARWEMQAAKRQAEERERQLAELRLQTARQGAWQSSFENGVRAAQREAHIASIFAEMDAIVNPPRDPLAEIDALRADLDAREPAEEDPGWAALKQMGRWR